MDKEQILQIVTKYVNQALEGQEIENPKLDFKRQWYDLKSKRGINEFLKDTSAIANTFGPDGYVIIGIDDKNASQVNANFTDSQLKDTNELVGIINKRVDRTYDINYIEEKIHGKVVGILHIPPSIDKPHVIKNYQKVNKDEEVKSEEEHRIFVRSGSITRVATKYDIELMVYDRKNIHPDYILDIYINEVRFGELDHRLGTIAAICIMNIENTGKRPASIKDFKLNFDFEDEKLTFSDPEAETVAYDRVNLIKVYSRNIIVKSNEVVQKQIMFFHPKKRSWIQVNDLQKKISGITKVEAELSLNNGKQMIIDCNLLFK